MVVDDIYWLDQIQPSHRSTVGDKAFYLGLLIQRGYPVIPGVVVPAITLQNFLAHMDWQEQMFTDLPNSFLYVDANNPRQLQTIAQQIRQAILATPLPEMLLLSLQAKIQQWQTSTVIFRPSFSLRSGLDPTIGCKTTGLMASHICRTDRDALAQGLKQAWSELFRAKSLFYWQRLGVQLQLVQFAVLVQPIQSVLAAGELQINGSQVEVWATRGLGHALAEGVADRYSFNLQTGQQTQQQGQQTYTYRIASTAAPPAQLALSAWLTDTQTGLQLDLVDLNQQVQPVLPLHQLQQLAQLAQQAQIELGMPLNLEWTLALPAEGSPAAAFSLSQIMPQFRSPSLAVKPTTQRLADPRPSPSLLSPKASTMPTAVANVPAIPPPADASRSLGPVVVTGLAAAPGQATAPAWILDQAGDLAVVPEGVIVIASSLTPEQVIRLQQVQGIVTEQGGMTSHAAILAREIGIPAVVGVEQVMQLMQTGDWVAMDGERGAVCYGKREQVEAWQSGRLESASDLSALSALSAPTLSTSPQVPSAKPQLWLTLSQLHHLPQMAALPVHGVGLLRSEMMMLDLFQYQPPAVWLRQKPPSEIVEQIAQRLQQFAVAFAPRPVFYRALDMRFQESPDLSAGIAPHPMLGVRGTFSYQVEPELLRMQLIAIRQIQKQGHDNLHLLLPFVRTVEEFVFCRQQVEQVGLLQNSRFQLWIMAEVPSVLLLLPEYVAAGVQGIAIGTNDLTQLLLGVDRDHPQMASVFNPYHPAVLRAIQSLIQTAHQLGIPCSICGQALNRHLDLLQSLLQWGISAISVDAREIDAVYQAMQQLSSAEADFG